jgi:DNA modification methylase
MTYTVYHQNHYDNIPDNSIDFILTDPPFNIARETNFHTYKNNTIHSYQFDAEAENNWDTQPHTVFLKQLNQWAEQFNRVLKKGGNFAVFTSDAYLSHFMEALQNNNLKPRRIISWLKTNYVPVNRKHMPASAVEYIIVGVKGNKATFNPDHILPIETLDSKTIQAFSIADKTSTIINTAVRKALLENTPKNVEETLNLINSTIKNISPHINNRVANMFKNNNNETTLETCIPNYVTLPLKTGNRKHPTEKPVQLLQYLISLYSNPEDTILDPFAGSGSTGEAAILLNRKPILVETEKQYYNIIVERMKNISESLKS